MFGINLEDEHQPASPVLCSFWLCFMYVWRHAGLCMNYIIMMNC